MTQANVLRARERSFPWGAGVAPHLMGIVNVTPDSFSDGGLHLDAAAAIDHGERCAREGAVILDVGGESTRPGAARVPDHEQVARVQPVVRALAARHAVSIDTTRAAVARAALEAGACMVNDVSGATEEPGIVDVAAEAGAALVLMHRRFAPGDDRWSTEHDPRRATADVVAEVRDWLAARVDDAVRRGMPRDRVAIDPGIGFGKDVAQNVELIGRLGEFESLGMPVLVGASRKSFLGALAGEPDPARRDPASVVAAMAAAARGAAILRVHAVGLHAKALAGANALADARKNTHAPSADMDGACVWRSWPPW
ncbi:MAG: dihydropteroate synthase [Planctomycetota bacterium]